MNINWGVYDQYLNNMRRLFTAEQWQRLINVLETQKQKIITAIIECPDFGETFGDSVYVDQIYQRTRKGRNVFLKRELMNFAEEYIGKSDQELLPDELDEEFVNGKMYKRVHWFYNYRCQLVLDEDATGRKSVYIFRFREFNTLTGVMLLSGEMVASTFLINEICGFTKKILQYITLSIKDTILLNCFKNLTLAMKISFASLFIAPVLVTSYFGIKGGKLYKYGKWILASFRLLAMYNLPADHESFRSFCNKYVNRQRGLPNARVV